MKQGVIVMAAMALLGCGSAPSDKPSEKAADVKPAKPAPPPVKDDIYKLPEQNRTSVRVVQDHLLGNPALPGGSIGDYQAKGQKYQLFVIETESPQDAAILLLDVKGTMKDAVYLASFGGYFGPDQSGTNLFVFAKSKYLAGVVGLPKDRADMVAREFATHL